MAKSKKKSIKTKQRKKRNRKLKESGQQPMAVNAKQGPKAGVSGQA